MNFIHVSGRMKEASIQPRREYQPKPRMSLDFSDNSQHNGGISNATTPKPSGKRWQIGETEGYRIQNPV